MRIFLHILKFLGFRAALPLAALSICHRADAENLIRNGSFENPEVPLNAVAGVSFPDAVPHWTGLPFVMGGFDSPSIWPTKGSEGRQYGDFGNGPQWVVRQTFSVPLGATLENLTWRDSTSSVLHSGSYRVSILDVQTEAVLLWADYAVGVPPGSDPYWVGQSLKVGDTLAPGHDYILQFQAKDTGGLDYLVDDVRLCNGPCDETRNFLPGQSVAYAANGGWIDMAASPGVSVAAEFLSGFAYAANFGWINLGNRPADNHSYKNDGVDFGVNRDATGNLTGFAYGANVGWINFGWAGSADPNRPRMDLATGAFHGLVYGANIGWISLETGINFDIAANPDLDHDGVADAIEARLFGNLSTITASSDLDGDGVLDRDEILNGTDPTNIDDPPPILPSGLAAGDQSVYGGNIGWINLKPSSLFGLRVTETALAGYAFAPNIGWISFAGGPPENGFSHGNADGSDYGVNIDDGGNLSGLAYSSSVGWINFEPSGQPQIDLHTGKFSGYAWGANIGWINLGTGFATLAKITTVDSDGDGLPDNWEMRHLHSLSVANSLSDTDGDGIADRDEYLAGTNPAEPRSYLRILSLSVSTERGEAVLTFPSNPAREYRIQSADNLGDAWADASSLRSGSDTSVSQVTLAASDSARFYRVICSLPKTF